MTFKRLEWSPAFELGMRQFDDDHRKLFEIVNDVGSSIEARDYSRCHVLCGQFVSTFERHLAEEESYLVRIGFPDIQGHQALHARLMSEAQALKTACDAPGDGRLMKACHERMLNCLIDDVVGGDSQFKSYIENYRHGQKGVTSDVPKKSPSSSARNRCA
jgi:hemerythrin-like metal-binding protein